MLTKLTYPDGEVVELDFNEKAGRHSYKVVSGKYKGVKSGVTTALGVINKPFLIQWAAKMTTEWIRENAKYSETFGKKYWLVNEKDLDTAKKNHSTYKDTRATEGTDLHSLIEQHIRGQSPKVPLELRPRFDAFLKWELDNKPEYLLDLVEKPVFSRVYGYCGRPDIPAIIDGKYGIIDLKSGKPDSEYNSYRHAPTGRTRAYPEHYYQTAAYDIALEELTGKKAKWYIILYLDSLDDGYYKTTNTLYYREAWIKTYELYKNRQYLPKYNPFGATIM